MSTPFSSVNDASTLVTIDPVTAFLHARRLHTSVAYLGQSEFELGRRLQWKGLDLVYRYECGALLICDVEANGVPEALDGAVRRLVAFVRALERHVPEVEVVTGLIPLRSADPSLDAVRSRLLSVYERLGAQPVSSEVPGMVKVVYPMHASTALPSRHAMAVPTDEAVGTAMESGQEE